jgi:LacI family transcriptional regulator
MASPKPKRRQKKRSSTPSPLRRIPHVLLLVETSGAVGRGMIEGIGRYAAENGPWSIKYEYRALDSLPPEWLNEWRGDGIISRTFTAKQAKILESVKLPRVELLGHAKYETAQVITDSALEGQEAAEHFLNRGLRHFAFFSFGEAWWIRIVRESFADYLQRRGYSCRSFYPPCHGQNVPVWKERYLPMVIEWLRALPRPIGIFTAGDLPAAQLLDLCRELNIVVPEEIAILGRGNDPVICETVRPTLSSLDMDTRRVGYVAAGLLARKMAGEQVQDIIPIPPGHVVVRQSTELMVIGDADVVQAMRFIRDHACSGIDVPRVAREVGLSRSVLERRFHQYLGRTPKAEIMRIRIERAKMLLGQTDNSRAAIAQICGFTTPEYFSMVFHRVVGMTANAYRKMSRISRERGTE